jgi:hypothetical protein
VAAAVARPPRPALVVLELYRPREAPSRRLTPTVEMLGLAHNERHRWGYEHSGAFVARLDCAAYPRLCEHLTGGAAAGAMYPQLLVASLGGWLSGDEPPASLQRLMEAAVGAGQLAAVADEDLEVRVIPDCHFRKAGTEYDRKPGIKWLGCTAK